MLNLNSSTRIKHLDLFIRKNSFDTQDDYLQLGQRNHEGEFYDIIKSSTFELNKKISPNLLFAIKIMLSP